MAPLTENHHHRNTTQESHKPFKSRHATKGFIKDLTKGKIENIQKGSRKTPYQQVMSKLDRRNQAAQKRQVKHQQNAKSVSVFAGQHGAPRIVAIVPLSVGLDTRLAIRNLNRGHDPNLDVASVGSTTVRIDRFKQTVEYIPVAYDLLSALDACRIADFAILLMSPSEAVDDLGESMLKSIESQGISNVITMVQHLDGVEPVKKRPQVVSSLKLYISRFLPLQDKIHSVDSEIECVNVIRSLCTITPKGVRWREERSWMLIQEVQWPQAALNANGQQDNVIVSGFVRGKGLKAERLVQVGDWGSFQIEKITDASLPVMKKRRADEMAVDVGLPQEAVLGSPGENQDDLAQLAPIEANMEDMEGVSTSGVPTERRGVLLDDHHYYSEDETHLPDSPKRLPKGTSSYQAAWFLGDMSDSGSEFEDEVDHEGDISMDLPALPQDGPVDIDGALQQHDPTEATPSEYLQSELFLDRSPDDEAVQLAEHRAHRKTEAEQDREFPDEIELHPDVLARERLARYRGLKSLRTSHWETSEDKVHEPSDWHRLLRISNYKQARNIAARETLVGGITPGRRVNIHLRSVPQSLRDTYDPERPLTLFSLLPHEYKHTVVNFSITLSSSHSKPLKSKEPLILQCGPRRFLITPLYSQLGTTPNNVHKYLRYLHPGEIAVATFVAPLTWGPVPALFFLPTTGTQASPTLIATGTCLPPDLNRIIAKRIILTGHPYKIHKKLVTVRYMFFNPEDVNWFKALQLWTKRGRSGYIKESLGTHGYFKATFDGRINPMDAVGISLYKRMWPRSATAWRADESSTAQAGEDAAGNKMEVEAT